MTHENIKAGLSQIGKTFDGSSVAYIKLDLEGKELDVASEELSNFRHLRYISLSGNHFDQVNCLSHLPYILKLDLKGNRLSSLELFNNAETFQYLQYLDLSKNLLQSLSGLALPHLETLKLSQNQISSIHEFKGHETLKSLELRGNKLTSLQGLHNLTALEELWLAENTLTSFHGLSNLPNLKKLHVRKNTISVFSNETLPNLPNLSYLNFRENEIVEVQQLGLLDKYKKLVKIVLADNPLKPEPSGDVKKETLIVLPQLKFLGKEEINPDEREEAVNEGVERKRIAEEARIEAEKAAKEAMQGEGEEINKEGGDEEES